MDKTRRPLELEITDMTYGGAGVGRAEEKAIFVHGAFPGDKVSATLTKSKKKWGEAELDNILTPSPLRRNTPCRYFEKCGGCPWMPLERKEQVAYKERILKDQLLRIGKCDIKPTATHTPSEEFGYRGRIQLHSSMQEGRPVIGFHARKTNLIVDIEKCIIANETINDVISALRNFIFKQQEFPRMKAKFEIETGYPVKGARITISYRDDFDFSSIKDIFENSKFINGISLNNGRKTELFQETILEMDAGGIPLFYGPGAFSQVNPAGNTLLVKKVLEFAGEGDSECLDLYCGIGNFSFPLAHAGYSVTGIELSKDAVTYARQNAEMLGRRANFFVGKAFEASAKMANEGKIFPLVVLDPPRIGAPGLGEVLKKLSAEKIIYVSCNPSSLGRDAAELEQNGYKLKAVEMVDMFPQTFHMESVALFVRN